MSSPTPTADPTVAAPGPSQGLRSAVYEGRVVHHRRTPVDHRFTYRIAMVYLDLSEVAEVCARHPLWSDGGRNAVTFRRSDYLGDPSVPLDVAVRDLVEARTGVRPAGPVTMLSQLRTWGWLFNPITTYYCLDATGSAVETVVVEVTNTPWHERTAYVLPGPGTHRVAKGMHVSPFLPMGLTHRFTIGEPGRHLTLAVDDFDGPDLVFGASMSLHRSPAGRRAQGRLLWRFPLMTLRVSFAIYRQALALKRKGVPFHRHPDRTAATAVDVVGAGKEH